MNDKQEAVTVAAGQSQWRVALTDDQKHEWLLMFWVSTLEHTLAWFEGMVLTFWSVKRMEDQWRLTLKAERRIPGKPPEYRVAFYVAEGMFECFGALAYGIKHGNIRWMEDKYPPNAGT